MKKQRVVIVGGGPAGLACAYELSKYSDRFEVILLEKDSLLGGIAKTINYKGYYFDLGGHRFFTKSDEVNRIWHTVLKEDFLKRPRLSRIYYNNKFFNYPLKPLNALFGLGLMESCFVLSSYLSSRLFPYPKEETFEEWVSNRFGKRLYRIFFKTYTEKVWGIPCTEIRAEWAAQRIKGLSIRTAVLNAIFGDRKKRIKTLINEFEYPKYGPGMMWNTMADIIRENGGRILLNTQMIGLNMDDKGLIKSVVIEERGNSQELEGEYFISSIPLRDLILGIRPDVDNDVKESAGALKYRGLITVALFIDKKDMFPDNWIYIHSPEVALGRVQNFKNWSPYMVPDLNKTCLGLEYFSTEGDRLWAMKESELIELGKGELVKIGLLDNPGLVVGGIALKTPKAYPVYDANYRKNIDVIKEFLNGIKNFQTIGRNGMHRYNNMDHSMLTGIYAARNVALREGHDIWKVNIEDEYHEEKI